MFVVFLGLMVPSLCAALSWANLGCGFPIPSSLPAPAQQRMRRSNRNPVNQRSAKWAVVPKLRRATFKRKQCLEATTAGTADWIRRAGCRSGEKKSKRRGAPQSRLSLAVRPWCRRGFCLVQHCSTAPRRNVGISSRRVGWFFELEVQRCKVRRGARRGGLGCDTELPIGFDPDWQKCCEVLCVGREISFDYARDCMGVVVIARDGNECQEETWLSRQDATQRRRR